MKKSFMNNIKHFVDSNVRHRIDKVAHNNNEFFGDDLLLVERHFEEIRHVCIEAEKRISTLLQSIQTTQTFGAYTQNVQAGLNNLSQNISQATAGTTSASCGSTNNVVTNIGNISSNAIRESSSKSSKHHLSPVAQSNRSNEIHGNTNDGHHSDVDLTQQLTTDIQLRHKKLPIVGFLKFLVKFCNKLKPDSLLGTTFSHCSQLQTQLTKLYLSFDQTVEAKCLKPIQQLLEIDIPNVIRLRKLFIKSHNDLESLRMKYNGASQKQQLQQAANSSNTSYTLAQTSNQLSNLNKLDNLKKDLDDCLTRFEQAKDAYETELFGFVCRETELVNLLRSFYQLQADYHQQVANVIQGSLPALNHSLANTSKKLVFGTNLDEHLRCTGRPVSPLIEICTHLLFTQGLREEGLFRVPGSSVKIKKLKNAINAWFVTSASNNNNNTIINNADSSEQKLIGYSSIVGLHDLFKRIAGQTQIDSCQQSNAISDDTIAAHNEINLRSHLLYFDVHSIAGLLKLYLRELPEPLFTFSLYEEWVGAMKTDSHDERLEAILKVLDKLPKTNYDNLKHLIKFLHILTCYQEHNKMTSTNLAITMAPSLIWSRPNVSHAASDEQSLPSDCNLESANSLNVQMSNIGLSASIHALVIETLIKNADSLFRDQEVDFTLPGFEHLTLHSTDPFRPPSKDGQRDRSLAKSTSPTGLSTTSSSSFSSTASQSKASSSTLIKTHSRKGGSMDGLINDSFTYESVTLSRSGLSNGNTTGRPMSVYLNKSDYSTIRASQHNPKQPPPVPPMPRSYLKTANLNAEQGSTNSASRGNQDSPLKLSTKMPAPPVPPAVCVSSRPEEPRSMTNIADLKPRATSLRGTGIIVPAVTTHIDSDQTTSSNHGLPRPNVVPRPSCPPPERPSVLRASEDGSHQQPAPTEGDESVVTKLLKCPIKSDEADSRSSHSLNSSGNLRADFEEISARDMDVEEANISSPSSPVASINSVSVEEGEDMSDDSSFNNDVDDDQSLDYSWAEFNLTQEHGVVERGLSTRRPIAGEYVRVLMESRSPSAAPRQNQKLQLDQPQVSKAVVSNSVNLETRAATSLHIDGLAAADAVKLKQPQEPSIQEHDSVAPPKKPPRTISPKISQSTPL